MVLLESLTNSIMKSGTNRSNQLGLPVRPGPVGQQDNRQLCIAIDPQRAARVAQMPNRIS